MTDFSSVFFRLTLVQFPELEFRLAVIRLLFSIISFNSLSFLDSCCLQLILFIVSFALKSPAIITLQFVTFWVIRLLRVVYIHLTSPIFFIFGGAIEGSDCYVFFVCTLF